MWCDVWCKLCSAINDVYGVSYVYGVRYVVHLALCDKYGVYGVYGVIVCQCVNGVYCVRAYGNRYV